ncbi:MAG: helix-turn-helix transcriptional regulator [Oscillospiraceae bacterium]|nr:helix-turn-helix transcriptional regulator [Oscillospiraceae bacterium]
MTKGYKLREIRTAKGYSQLEIVNVLNTTQQQYSKYETGAQELPARHILTLCQFYRISADELLGVELPAKETK